VSSYVVETRGLTKRFGQLEAVSRLDLRVEPGQTYGLLGPNGSGKTTLIRMLVGLIMPTTGVATVLGRRMPNREVLSQVGYMTQAEAIYLDLTVRENIAFFGTVYGGASRERVSELIELVNLEERADSLASTLSGGMRRRVSLACALVHHPRLLLLDEPTVGIDPELRALFWQHFRQLNEEGVSIIVSTHVMDEAEHCHRLGMLRQGRLLAEGSPTQLRERAGKPSLEEAFLHYAGGGGG
jgi:ABC-2 type transport system ATP-binding protein